MFLSAFVFMSIHMYLCPRFLSLSFGLLICFLYICFSVLSASVCLSLNSFLHLSFCPLFSMSVCLFSVMFFCVCLSLLLYSSSVFFHLSSPLRNLPFSSSSCIHSFLSICECLSFCWLNLSFR